MSDVTPIALDLDLSDLETDAGEEDAQPKGKKLGLIPMAIAAVAAAGVAGGAAFVLTPGAKNVNPACIGAEDGAEKHGEDHGEAESHGEDHADAANEHDGEPVIEECETEDHGGAKDDKKKKKADKGHGGGHGGDDAAQSSVKPIGAVQHSEHATFLVLDPMVISIQPIGRSKHLRVSLVFETDEEGAASLLENGFYVQDVLNTYLRSVDHTVLEDPSSMSRLRAQILRRIRVIVPDASVTNVLITEFVLT
ncbi:flagellar basal body-associated FliL family protein [Hyphococcus sp.]|uniref:flagellar basal body-associated FliL family protein n=1 Tax=Hyphococcus sp. TaxID=2038636 RepID=UPI003D10F03F